jgi:sarcosine oxidase subunit alpha
LEEINLTVNNEQISVQNGSTVATAIFSSDAKSFRRSVTGEKRFPLCGMGICFECRVSINGMKHQRSCQILAKDGMIIETDG